VSQRIRGLDGLRAVAFVLVFVSHKVPTPVTDRLGSVAVWLFFVLSGFLITRILAEQRKRIAAGIQTRTEALSNFLLARACRILPPYYALLAVLTLLAATGHFTLGPLSRQLADWLFFTNLYFEHHGYWGYAGHFWSLAVEQQYYFLFAPAALWVSASRLPMLCLALLMVSIAAHVILLERHAALISFDLNSFANFGLFGIGGIAGLFAARPLPRWMLNEGTILAVGLLFAFLAALPVPQFSEYGRAGGVLAGILLVQLTQRQTSTVVQALELGPVRRLGQISYGAYLFHPLIQSQELLALVGIRDQVGAHWLVASDFFITVVLAQASWIILEAPMIRFARRHGRVGPAAEKNDRDIPQTKPQSIKLKV